MPKAQRKPPQLRHKKWQSLVTQALPEFQYPVLQDNIYIAPGAIIIGDITVGSDVAIGSNSVLTKSVEDYSVVVGIPGKVISKKGSLEYVSNRI